MRHERLEPLVVYPGKVKHRVTTIACSHSAQTVLVNERFLRHCVNTVEVVLHIHATVIARDLLAPVAAEAGVAATVDSHHDIAVGRHHLIVPPVAPALSEGSLGPALAVKKCRVFLRGIKVRRIDDPHLQVLAILRLYVAFLAPAHFYVLVYMAVYIGNHGELSVGHIHFRDFGGACH